MNDLSVYVVFIAVCLFSCGYAAEATKEIPKDIAPILSAYESEAKKAWDIYQSALQKAEDKAKKDFGAKMAPALKKGDLDAANAIKVYLDKVTSGEAVSEYEAAWNATKKDTDLLGDAKGLVILEATWGVPGTTLTDVKAALQKLVKNNSISVENTYHIGVADPAKTIPKIMTIKYALNGKVTTITVGEMTPIVIPAK